MSEYSDNGFSVQWIIHFQCFHYLGHVYIKEFSAFCIQTNDYFTYYVKSAPALLHKITQNKIDIYARQTLKHGFKWEDGNIYFDQLVDILAARIPKFTSKVYTFSRTVYNFFKWRDNKPYTYPFIYHIDKIPHQVSCNKISACGREHSHNHCAEKQLHKKILCLRPVLVPYLALSLMVDFKQHQKFAALLEVNDNMSIKYGKHNFEDANLNKLFKVNLAANGDCQYSFKG